MIGLRRVVGSVVLLTLATAACSSTSTSTSSGSTQNVAGDRALARAANLRLSDFPAGWTATANPESSSGQGVDKDLASCLKTNAAAFAQSAPTRVSSPEFGDTSHDMASSSITYLASTSEAETGIALFQQPTAAACLQTVVTATVSQVLAHPTNPSETLPLGMALGSPMVAPLSFPTLGNQSVAYRVTIPITGSSLSLSLYVDLVIAQKGRAIALLTFVGALSPFDPSLEQHLSTLTVGRLVDT